MQLIDEKNFKANIASKIKNFRKESQEKTAKKASISVDTLSSVERAKSIIFSLTLVNLCNTLNITPNDILSDFISNKSKLLDYELCSEFSELSIDEKNFILEIAKFLKHHNK